MLHDPKTTRSRMAEDETTSATPEVEVVDAAIGLVRVPEGIAHLQPVLTPEGPAVEVAELEREECAVAHLASPCPDAKPPRFRVGIKGFAVTTYRDAIGLDHDAPSPGRKQVRGEQVVIEAATAAAAREEFCRRFGVRSSSKPIKVSDA
jgi:hypothetical protein